MAPIDSKLRVDAPAFMPMPATQPINVPSSADSLPDDPWGFGEMSVSPAELEELEEVESWVNMMAEFEGMEQDHLIELSLRHADKGKIAQIKAAALSHKAKHKPKHHSKAMAHHA